jgi:exopolysaccharide biosynthesis protein
MITKKKILFPFILFYGSLLNAQLKWINVDSLYQPLPKRVHVYKTTDSLDGKPNIAFYVIADLKNKRLDFTADTTRDRRITPTKFYEKDNRPLLIVNCTFFSYETNRSLNTVIKDGKLVGYNIHSIAGRGKDTFTYRHPFTGAIGISKKRTADIAWLLTDSLIKYPFASQIPYITPKDSVANAGYFYFMRNHPQTPEIVPFAFPFIKWKMQTAVGGGPVLLQNGEMKITNNEELKFTGKAIEDKHPRTAMGYTKDNKLVILLIQGRFPDIAEGATLTQEALLLKNIGCWEALNLDGGGSSCMLINGKETIKPSDKEGQRPVPAVFLIHVN